MELFPLDPVEFSESPIVAAAVDYLPFGLLSTNCHTPYFPPLAASKAPQKTWPGLVFSLVSE
ncbi:MAG: hypothetical protein N2035_09980 [Chthoniobacterales bacterium]|nr:hypothetical protein [Chthoniobacterales bacterium]MCX7713969.1 hypothetical protein [Chthoniobacterales bacterium]